MKKKYVFIAFAVILVLLISGALWYTRPMTLAELYPELDWPACDEISVVAYYYRTIDSTQGPDEYRFTLSSDDPEFSQILAQFQNRTFRRSLLGLLPRGTWTHPTQVGDFRWDLVFNFNDYVELPDGSAAAGALLHFDNFYEKLEVSYLDDTWRCTTSDFDQWRSDIMDIICDHQEINP